MDKNIERPSKIARIGCNLCSYIFFLGKYNILPFSEVQKLHDYCVDLGSSMIRSARAERIGEEYSSFVRKCYLNTEAVENVSLFNGGFEVAYCGKRFCLLKDWSESGAFIQHCENQSMLLIVEQVSITTHFGKWTLSRSAFLPR